MSCGKLVLEPQHGDSDFEQEGNVSGLTLAPDSPSRRGIEVYRN